MASHAQLTHHIRKHAQQGISYEDIKKRLKRIGWRPDTIDEAIATYQRELKEQQQLQSTQQLQYSGPAFTHNKATDQETSIIDLPELPVQHPALSDQQAPSQTALDESSNQHPTNIQGPVMTANPYDYSKVPAMPKQNLSSNPVADKVYHPPEKSKQGFPPFDYIIDILSGVTRFRAVVAILLFAVLVSIYPSYLILTYGLTFAESSSEKITALIETVVPSHLIVNIVDGVASTNVTEPYNLTITGVQLEQAIDMELFSTDENEDQPVTLMQLNTKGTVEDFDKNEALSMLTARSLVYQSDNQIKLMPLDELENTVVTQKMLVTFKDQIFTEYAIEEWMKTILYALPWLMVVATIITKLAATFAYAMINWLANKISKVGIPFHRIFAATALLYLVKEVVIYVLELAAPSLALIGTINVILRIALIGVVFFGMQAYQKNYGSKQ